VGNRLVLEKQAKAPRQLFAGGIAFVDLLPKTFQAYRLQIPRRLRLKLSRRHWLLVDDLQEGIPLRRRLEWWPARQALVQDRPQGVHIGSWTCLLRPALGLLRRHVARSAHDDPAECRGARIIELFGQAEVGNLGSVAGHGKAAVRRVGAVPAG